MNKPRLLLLLLVPIVGAAFYLRSLASWRPKKVFSAPGKIWQLAFSSDGQTLLIGQPSPPSPAPAIITGMVMPVPATVTTALQVESGFKPLWQHKDVWPIESLQFFARNSQILRQGSSIQVLDTLTGKLRKDYGPSPARAGVLPASKWFVARATISPDGRWLAYKRFDIIGRAEQDGRVYLKPSAPIQQGQTLSEKTIGKPSDNSQALAFSPDGKTLAVGVGDQSGAHIDFYEVKTWRLTRTWRDLERAFPGESPSYTAVQWSRDGRFLLSSWKLPAGGTGSEGLRVWRLSDGKKLGFSSWTGSRPEGGTLSQIEDDGRVLTIGSDGEVFLRNTPNLDYAFKPLLHLPNQQIAAAALSPDGSYLLAGTASGNLYRQRLK